MPSPQTRSTEILLRSLQGVLAQVSDPVHVLRTILEQAVAQTGAERGLFVEVAGSGELEYRVLHQFQQEQLNGPAGEFSRNLFASVIEDGEGVLLFSAIEDPRFRANVSVDRLRICAVLCMPIAIAGRIAALVYLENRRAGHFQEEHRQALRSLLELAAPVLEALQAGREILREGKRLEESEGRLRHEVEEARRVLTNEWSFGRFVGRSAAVRELREVVRKAAATDFPVLLLGETGTGKGILARVIHHSGARASQAFVTVFCPSLERGMVEPELFGHRKGAFTGALTDRLGKVQAADGGTLFLDEIGELPLEIQPKLLRLLQEKTYERVGDPGERRANVRVIGATNRNLEDEVEKGHFRRDLFERLNYVPVRVPPLRDRREDIPLLLRHALDQHGTGRWVEIAAEAEQLLVELEFMWPGNVRHVEQLAARLTMEPGTRPVSRESLLEILGPRVKGASAGSEPAGAGAALAHEAGRTGTPPADVRVDVEERLDRGLRKLLEEAERGCLEEALRRYPTLTRAELARKLKISEAGLYKKLRAYGLGK